VIKIKHHLLYNIYKKTNLINMAQAELSFKPKAVVKRLLEALPDRACDVITMRYGLGKEVRRMTLDAIGKKYGITRERVRQIENYAGTRSGGFSFSCGQFS
jgi:DNA-directed RNA polymerase sigma subunit (sigma70/sigma32)